MRKTVAEQLVNTLADAGVRRVYGIVGDSLNPGTDAIRRSETVDWIHVRNEEAGAFAAGADAELTGQLEMEVAGYPHHATELKNPSFAALAEAVGLTGVRVENPAEVRPALERVLACEGPALLDVVTDPNALAMPPKATIAEAQGFALAMTKMMFAGEVDDVIGTVMSNWRMLP